METQNYLFRSFGSLYIKKLKITATIPKRSTEGAAGYDVSAAEEVVVPAKGKILVKTSISMAIPDGCYGRIAHRAGLAVETHIDIGAGVVDKDHRGEFGVVMFNYYDEDLPIEMDDRIDQLVFEQINTPDVQEVEKLDETVRGEQEFGSTGMNDSVQNEIKDPSRVSVLQRVQGKPRMKTTTNSQNKCQFISVKMQK